MSNHILSQVQNLSLDEKRELLGLLDELEEAKASYRKAIVLNPNYAGNQ